MKTIVTQIIPTIQGEGPTIGTPILLIRTGNCNLNCHMCDTKWSKLLKVDTIKEFDIKNNKKLPFIVDENTIDDFINYVNDEFLSNFTISTVLITGGEPLLDKEFVGSLIYNKNTNLKNINKIEIETNGILLNDPKDYLLFFHWEKQIQLNISPKMDILSYNIDEFKTIDDIITLFKKNSEISIDNILTKTPTTINWKFVYLEQFEKSIDLFINKINNVNNIYITPLTPFVYVYNSEINFLNDFRESTYKALDYCMRKGYILTPRFHVWLFNKFQKS